MMRGRIHGRSIRTAKARPPCHDLQLTTHGSRFPMIEHAKFFVIQLGRMGDIVQSLPLFIRLKEERGPCEITLLCIREPVELIRKSAPVDRFVTIPYGYYERLYARRKTTSGLSFLLDIPELRESYDLVINLTHDVLAASICYNMRGEMKSGMVCDPEGRVSIRGDWGKYLFSVINNRKNRAENLINLVDVHIGMGGLAHKAMDGQLAWGAGEARRAEQLLIDNGWRRRGKLVAFQMGTHQPHRAWPVRNFVELGAGLAQRPGVETVLLGAPQETGLAEEFLRQSEMAAINLIGKTTIEDLPAILGKCDLLVSSDTGTAHIAAAAGTRVLGLYFSTAFFGETAPFGAGNVVLQVETECTPCLRNRCPQTWCRDYLRVEAVRAAAEMMLFGRPEPLPDFPSLSICKSRFLSNGTLIYAPLTERTPQFYQGAVINRILWEGLLGLEVDQAFFGELLPRLRPLESFRAKIEERRTEYASLGALQQEALRVVRQGAVRGGAAQLPDDEVSRGLGRLEEIDKEISAMGDSLMAAFHRFEMMGLDCAHPREPHWRLIEKYAKLFSMTHSSIEVLETLARGGFDHDRTSDPLPRSKPEL